MKDRMENIMNQVLCQIEGQASHLDKVNAKEFGEVIDALHHLEEAMYYCSIIEAMEKTSEKESHQQPMNISYYMESGDGQSRNSDSSNNIRNYVPYMEYAPYMMRDEKWRDSHMYGENNTSSGNGSRSYYSRRMYMESKQDGSDNQKSMKELEHYMKDLGEELTEMITSSTPEEKQVLANKLQVLASKVMK